MNIDFIPMSTITNISTIDDESNNLISYSSNGSNVSIRTKIGEMSLSSIEFTLYQVLFKIADLNNCGRLNVNSHLQTLLLRTNLSTQQIDVILTCVNGKNSRKAEQSDPKGLNFNQWLVLCKLIAYTQMRSVLAEDRDYVTNEEALDYMHSYSLLILLTFLMSLTAISLVIRFMVRVLINT